MFKYLDLFKKYKFGEVMIHQFSIQVVSFLWSLLVFVYFHRGSYPPIPYKYSADIRGLVAQLLKRNAQYVLDLVII